MPTTETPGPVVGTFTEYSDKREAEDAERHYCEGCGRARSIGYQGRLRGTVLVPGKGYWHLNCWRKSYPGVAI